ncbi:MAG: ATP-dependent helicase [Deltaproteobacteria bacterium]|nr:ATP-dependent helicase [Deltaproteobacteria bacterium]
MKPFQPTDEQRHIIEFAEGCALVVAAPGSGKTEVLTRRAERLLQRSEGQNARVLALTFSTRAGDTIRDRLEATLGADSRRVVAQTFHAFATDVLTHYGDKPNRTIYDREEDRLQALSEALADEEPFLGGVGGKELKNLLARIGRWKRDLVTPEAAQLEEPAEAAAYAAYNRRLEQLNAADFDDLLFEVNQLFQGSPSVARHYRRLFRHVMIDEAQDTSRVQYEIIRALCGADHRNVVLFADDHQALYGFAGADRRFLRDFATDFAPVERFGLTKNFRCATAIVRTANGISDKLVKDVPRRMLDDGRAPGRVFLREFGSVEEEAQFVVGQTQQLLRDGLPPEILHAEEARSLVPENICVLARARYALDAIVAGFASSGVEVAFSSGPRPVFDSQAGQNFLDLCRILRNPKDAIAWRRLLSERADGSLVHPPSSPPEVLKVLASGSDGIARLAMKAQRAANPMSDVQVLIDAVGEAMRDWPTGDENERASIDNDWDLVRDRWRRVRADAGHDVPTLEALLNDLSLVGRTALDRGGVRVLTVHAAKGLEFRAVFLVGMNEGTFPDYRAKSQNQIEEERRSAYVAVTRAQRWLCVTRAKVRGAYLQTPSGFLREMNLDLK